MILGVAQVVVNAAGLAPQRDALLGAGYTETFVDSAIPNHPAKAPLQARPRERLEMAHFAAPAGGVAVEVTAYAGEPPAGRAPFELALPAKGEVMRVRAAVPDVAASRGFWRDALRFREQDDGSLLFRAIRPEWTLELELAASDAAEPETSVDADGCVLVTLLTTALEADFASLRDRIPASRAAPPWEETIDGRPLRVAMIEGPGGELLELLQPPTHRPRPGQT